MTTFDERQKSYEKKFVHEQEMQFKILARRNRLLGEWAATQLHLEKDKVDAYAQEILHAGVNDPKHEAVLTKIMSDFEKAGLEIDQREVERQMANFYDTARKQFEEAK